MILICRVCQWRDMTFCSDQCAVRTFSRFQRDLYICASFFAAASKKQGTLITPPAISFLKKIAAALILFQNRCLALSMQLQHNETSAITTVFFIYRRADTFCILLSISIFFLRISS